MRHGKTFRKRCLTFLLSLAMVLTSVNVPMLTVWAEEETSNVNDDNDTTVPPTDDGNQDSVGDGVEGDVPGDGTTPADPSQDVTTPDDGENPVGGGINQPTTPADPTEGDADDSKDDATTPDDSENDGTTSDDPDGDAEDPDDTLKPVDPDKDESNPVEPKGEETGKAVDNKFEAPGTHGATYDKATKKVTFFINSDDAAYTACIQIFCKEYDSYATAARNHNKNGGDFIAGLAPAVTFADGVTEKKVEVPVAENTGAILYYFNCPGYPRTDYEHIIVINPDAEPSAPTEPTSVPKKPDGLNAFYWDQDTPDKGKIYIAWAGVSPEAGDQIQSWELSIDGKELVTLSNNPQTSTYFASNGYAAGEHTVTLVAINSVGPSEAATKTFTLTQEQAGLKEPKKKNNIIISEQLAQAKAGEKITLSWVADNEEFTFEDYTVKINGTAVDDLKKITVGNDTIEMDASLFASAGTYRIQFEKEGFNFSPVYQVVYAADTTDNWNMIWNDEFSGTSLDTTKWDYQTGNGSAYGVAGWGNSEAQIYTKNNTTVADGKLTITGKKEANGSYTSARLRTVKEEITDGKAAVGEPLKIGTYGKVESKIKMPAGNGIWPAFWMLPHDSEYGTWAASGEIDIMEARGRLPGEVCGTIHYGNVWPNNSSSGKTYNFKDGDSIDQYHVYTLEWDPTEMRWYVDGELYSSLSNWYSVQSESGNYPYPAPFDEEFYVLLNLALGGTFDSGTTEIAVDENGVDMDVDYVRWYQRAEGYDDWEIKQPETPKDDTEDAKALLATAVNGNFIKDSDFSQMDTKPYTAGGTWDIKSGYWAPLLIPGNGNGKATWSKEKVEDKNYLKVAVDNVGSQTYSSQMLQYFPVVKGYSYEISYTAYTDAVKQKADISMKIGGDDDNGWAVYSGNYTDKLTTTPTTYTHKFTMSADTDPTARFEFNLATSAGNVYLSDVIVKLVDSVSEDEDEDNDKEPLNDGNHVYNGGFSNGTDGLLYWHWGTADESAKVSVVRENKERKAKITASTSDPVSMWQYGMNLLQKDDYVLTFDIESDAEQDIELKVTNQDGSETYASATKTAAAGASTVEWQFTQPEGKTDTSGKLTLTFNGNAKIDNVKLIRTTFNNVDYDKVDLYPISNGDFSNGESGWNIWHEGAGWETHKVNDNGQLELNNVKVDADATFYCIGIKSPSMTLTKGVNYKVKFDYTLPADKTYTLELCGVQKEIKLQAGTHTYESDAFPGNGSGVFALYLGPYQTSEYTFILDNVVVSAVLPEKDGYKKPVSLAQTGKVRLGSDVVVTYSGDTAEREEAWGSADKKYYLKGVEIDASKVSLDTTKKTITLDSSLFEEDGEFAFYVKADGYTATKAISLSVLNADGNLLVNGNFSSGTAGWTFYMADWEGAAGGSFDVNDDGIAVINHQWDSGEDWHFQLHQDLDYAAGDYFVTFDAWADVERPINVRIQPDGSSPAVANANSHVVLSTEKKNYKLIWKGLAAGSAHRFDIAMGSMSYEGVTAPNDGNNPYNIYLDNIIFRPLTADDENSIPATIASAGAGKAGTDDVTITCTAANEKWQNAAKTVYVNKTAISADKVTDNKTSLVIDKSVFTEGGKYSIYVIAEGFDATNTIQKTMLAGDGNLILGGDMNNKDLWKIADEDAKNLSMGWIAAGKYILDYTAGYYRSDWNCWVTWSSQLVKENISVENGKSYTFFFEAYTDLEGGRDIILEHAKSTAGDGERTQSTVHIDKGYGVYSITIKANATCDDYVVKMLLGPVGTNLQVDTANGEGNNVVPHKVLIDNVVMLEAGQTNKIILKAVLEEYADKKDDSAIATAYTNAQTVCDNNAATQAEIDAAIDGLRKAGGEPVIPDKPVDKTGLTAAINKYKDYKADDYTPETWTVFATALEEAQTCLAKENATQKEVDEAAKKLEDAAAALVKKGDDPNPPTPEHHEGLWIKEIPAQTYTGAAIKPEIEVRFNDELLQVKKDYTVAYKKNTNAGEATVTVTGKGNFKGRDTATFTINKKNIEDEDIDVANVYAIINSKGKVTNPKVTVKFGKKTLKNQSDYAVAYPDLATEKDDKGNDKIVAKDYVITINTDEVKKDKKGNPVPSANYTGSRTITYTVLANDTKLMSKAKVVLEKTKVDYAGENGAATEKPTVKSVKIGNTTLTENVDYTVRYDNWDKTGKATVIIEAKEGTVYYGSKSVTYTVNGTKLVAKDLVIDGIKKEYAYTGEAVNVNNTLIVKPKVEGSEPFVEGKDYEVSYKTGKKLGEHTNVGTVTVTITGINAYTGSVNKTFKITAVDLTAFGKENAPAGLAFEALKTAKYTKTGAKPEIITLTFNGEPLVEKQDYTVTYAKNNKIAAGTQSATMTIKGKGNFKGQIKHTYEVIKASAADVDATATDIVKPTKFNKLKPTVKVVELSTGKALKAGTDYEKAITYYSNAECTEQAQITAQNFDEWLAGQQADRAITVYAKVVMKGNYADETPGSLTAEFKLYDSSKKITDTKKYTIKVETDKTAAGETIVCDKKGNPIYTGSEIKPMVTVIPKGTDVKPLVLGTDYVVSYDKHISKGKATVTVTGVGDYGGTKSLKFTIVSTDMKWYTEAAEKIATFFSNLF